MLVFFRFASILFLIFEKSDKQKNCVRFFKICKYTFLIFEKGHKRKNCVRFFKICKYTFQFDYFFSIKRSYRDFWGFYVCFLMWLFFSMNRGHIDIWCFYVCFFNVIIFLVWMGVIWYFEVWIKISRVCRYPFLFILKS